MPGSQPDALYSSKLEDLTGLGYTDGAASRREGTTPPEGKLSTSVTRPNCGGIGLPPDARYDDRIAPHLNS